jgi:sugar/nucleoside kinase (ribokinase family)
MSRIVCLGDVMVDLLARLPGPLAPGSDTPAPIRALGGGSAANTACWLASAGVPVGFVGRVGNDVSGRMARDALTECGIELALSVDPDLATGMCIVLVDVDGERTMIPDAGANAGLRPEHVPTELIRSSGWLHLSGYALFGAGRPAARHALQVARSAGVPISVGAASSAPLRSAGPETFLGWIGTGVTLFANRDEAAVLSGVDDPVSAARWIGGRVGAAIITCGAGGAVWSDGETAVHRPVPPVGVTPVDTTGSGDAFAAGALAALYGGAGPAEALDAGHGLAARTLSHPGARPFR